MAGWDLLLFCLLLPSPTAPATVASTTVSIEATVTSAVTANTATLPNCHELTGTVAVVDTAEVCSVADDKDYLGNQDKHVIFDFSRATQDALDGLLGRKNLAGRYIFKEFYGAIIMDSNPKITKFDFFDITKLEVSKDGKDTRFINICNNAQLTTISAKKLTRTTQMRRTNVLIYNNPSLDENSLKAIRIFHGIPSITAYLQSNAKECRFAHPLDSTKDTVPTNELLKNCETISGDLILPEGSAPQGQVTLDKNACLVLIGVDMTDFTITPPPDGQGAAKCKNGRATEIRDNRGLCGDRFEAVKKYFNQIQGDIVVEMDELLCKACTSADDVIHPSVNCSIIEGYLDISRWFTANTLLMEKPKDLEKAIGTILVVNIQADSIKLPKLMTADGFKISRVQSLKTIELASLTHVKFLEISHNSDLMTINLPRLQKAYTVRIFGNDKITELRLNNLQTVKTLEIIGNPELKLIELNSLKLIRKLRVVGNPQLKSLKTSPHEIGHLIIDGSPALDMRLDFPAPNVAELTRPGIFYGDLRRVFPRLLGDLAGWKIDCFFRQDTVIRDYEEIYHCTKIRGGDLILDGLSDDPTEWRLEYVEKSVILKNTQLLTTADFLKDVAIGGKTITFKDSRNICRLKKNDTTKIVVEKEERTLGCDLIACKSLGSPPNCQIFIGDLILQYPVDVSLLKNLIYIYGRLFIQDTDLEEIEFPKLKEIYSHQAPLVKITKNDELTKILWPNLEKITPVGSLRSPQVEITKNRQLTKVDFISKHVKCSKSTTGTCHFDNYGQKEQQKVDSDRTEYYLLIVAVVLGSFALIGLLAAGLFLLIIWGQLTEKGREKRAQERKQRQRREQFEKMERLKEIRAIRKVREEDEEKAEKELNIRKREQRKLDSKTNPDRSIIGFPANH